MKSQNPTLKTQTKILEYLRECEEKGMLTTPSEIREQIGSNLTSVKKSLEFLEMCGVVNVMKSPKGTWFVGYKTDEDNAKLERRFQRGRSTKRD